MKILNKVILLKLSAKDANKQSQLSESFNIPQLSEARFNLSHTLVYEALQPMKNDKNSRNDCVTKEVLRLLLNDIIFPLIDALNHSFDIVELSSTKRF